MESHPGFTDVNNVWLAFSGARRKRFSMGTKPPNGRDITTLKSF